MPLPRKKSRPDVDVEGVELIEVGFAYRVESDGLPFGHTVIPSFTSPLPHIIWKNPVNQPIRERTRRTTGCELSDNPLKDDALSTQIVRPVK